MKRGYRFLEHTADMGIEAQAGSCQDVLQEMAWALKMMLFGNSPATASVAQKLRLHADDPVELMIVCLNEIVFWCEQGNLVLVSLQVERFSGGMLHATLTGEPFNPSRHHVERQVKSVTYHQACLEKNPAGWYARVYVDL